MQTTTGVCRMFATEAVCRNYSARNLVSWSHRSRNQRDWFQFLICWCSHMWVTPKALAHSHRCTHQAPDQKKKDQATTNKTMIRRIIVLFVGAWSLFCFRCRSPTPIDQVDPIAVSISWIDLLTIVHIYIFIYIYVHTHTHVCTHVHTCVYTCVYTCAHMCVHMCTHVCTCVYTCAHMCAHVHDIY